MFCRWWGEQVALSSMTKAKRSSWCMISRRTSTRSFSMSRFQSSQGDVRNTVVSSRGQRTRNLFKKRKKAYTYTSYAFEIYYVFPRRKGWELTFKPMLLKKKCNLGLKCLYKCHHNMIYTHFYIMYLYILIGWSQKWQTILTVEMNASNQCHCHTHPLK